MIQAAGQPLLALLEAIDFLRVVFDGGVFRVFAFEPYVLNPYPF